MRESTESPSASCPPVEIRILGARLAAPVVLFFRGDSADLFGRLKAIFRELPESDRLEVRRGAQLLAVLQRPLA